MLGAFPAGGLGLAEPAVAAGLEFAFTIQRELGGGGQDFIRPAQQVGLAHGVVAHRFAPRLVDDHLYRADIIDAVKHFNGAQAVAHELRVPAEFFGRGADRDTDAMLVVDHYGHAVRKDDAVGGAAAAGHPPGDVHPLFHEHPGVRAGRPGLFVFFHYKGSVPFGAGLHLGVVVVEVLSRVLHVLAQRTLYQVGAQFMGAGAFCRIGAGLFGGLGAEHQARRAVQDAVAGGRGEDAVGAHTIASRSFMIAG